MSQATASGAGSPQKSIGHLTGLPLYLLLAGLTATQASGTMLTVTLPTIGPEVTRAFGVAQIGRAHV